MIDAYMRKYDRVYNPEANEEALAEKDAQRERAAKFDALFPDKGKKK